MAFKFFAHVCIFLKFFTSKLFSIASQIHLSVNTIRRVLFSMTFFGNVHNHNLRENISKKLFNKIITHNCQFRNQRVNAKAHLGEDEVTSKKSFVEEELHLATIPFVGRFENNSLFIH